MNSPLQAVEPRRRRQPKGAAPNRDRWLVPYADLVTLLLALFIILYAAANRDRAHAVAQAFARQLGDAEATPVNNGKGILPGGPALSDEQIALEKAFAANPDLRAHARLNNTEHGLVISLAEAGFFPSGDAAVNQDALPLLDTLADALRDSKMALRVEGHTDSTQISTARYPSNWELSASRASVVLSRLMARGIPAARLSLAGYADVKPLADNETATGRALNRRVDVVLVRQE